MKRGKEITLNLPYQYNVVSGTVDNKNPKSLYIQISAWGLPTKEYENYEKVIRNKSTKVKKALFNFIDNNKFYRDRSIVDFNMASSGVTKGKRSYMSVEMTLFKREPLIPVNSEKIIPTLNDISEEIIKSVFEGDEDFKFYRRKNGDN
jgi:hypothetical protein